MRAAFLGYKSKSIFFFCPLREPCCKDTFFYEERRVAVSYFDCLYFDGFETHIIVLSIRTPLNGFYFTVILILIRILFITNI